MSRHDVVHVAPGLSAASTIRQALNLTAPSTLVALDDCLSVGLLQAFESIAQWRTLRDGYWTGLSMEPERSPGTNERSPFDLVDRVGVLSNCDSIVLWIGTGLAEQLLLVWFLELLRIVAVDPSRLQVIQYARLGSQRAEVIGIGELNADLLRAHPPAQRLDPAAIAELHAAWSAITSPDPAALLSFLASNPGCLPFLTRDLRFLLDRYPDHRSGLSLWDRLLLERVAEKGPRAVRVIGYTMGHDFYRADWVGDLYLFARLRRMGASDLAHPLLSLNSSTASMRETTVELTDAGRAVLNGEANAVRLNGIDDWVAGVHLDSRADRVWFNRDGILVPKMHSVEKTGPQ
jgi:uncharacterized protein DUF1835